MAQQQFIINVDGMIMPQDVPPRRFNFRFGNNFHNQYIWISQQDIDDKQLFNFNLSNMLPPMFPWRRHQDGLYVLGAHLTIHGN